MLTILDPLRGISFPSIMFRMLLAFLCGLCVGIERSSKNRPAGFRTHILVCIAAASASMIGHYMYLCMQLPVDVSRMGAAIIQGLGFLGAGTIIVTKKQTVKGLTTAAGLWATGICGLAIGAGFYEGGIIATFIIILIATVVTSLGSNIRRISGFDIDLHYDKKSTLTHIMRYCKDNSFAITNLQITGVPDKTDEYAANMSLRPGSDMDYEILLDHIREIDGVVSVKLVQ